VKDVKRLKLGQLATRSDLVRRALAQSIQWGQQLVRRTHDSPNLSEGWLFVLPVEIQLKVMSLLAPADLAVLSRASKRSNKIASDDFLWKRLFAERFTNLELDQRLTCKEAYKQALKNEIVADELQQQLGASVVPFSTTTPYDTIAIRQLYFRFRNIIHPCHFCGMG